MSNTFPYCAHRQTEGKQLHYTAYRLTINIRNYESNDEVPANLINPFGANHNWPGGSKLRGNGNGDLLKGTEKRIFAIRSPPETVFNNILIIKVNKMHYFTTLFWQRTPYVSDRTTVHHQGYLNNVYTSIGICHASSVDWCAQSSAGET